MIIKDLLSLFLQHAFSLTGVVVDAKLFTAAILAAGLVFPLSTKKNLSSLRFSSFLAFTFAVALVVIVGVRSIQEEYCDVPWFQPDGYRWIQAVPILSFGFICELNVLPVYSELANPNLKKVSASCRLFVLPSLH